MMVEKPVFRCTCEREGVAEGEAVQCQQCHFWLHGYCVGSTEDRDNYSCPFCHFATASSSSNKDDILDVSSDHPSMKRSKGDGKPRRYNVIEDYIHGSDAVELIKSFKGSIDIQRSLTRQPFIDDVEGHDGNFEFCSVVIVPSSSVLKYRMAKSYEVKEVKKGQRRGIARFGVFLLEPLDPGQFIDCYLGHYHHRDSLRARLKQLQPCPQPFILMPDTMEHFVVDARRSGNEMRYMRRSCRPNVTIKPIYAMSDKSLHIGVFSMNGLRAGEELLAPLDGLPFFKYECACGQADLCLAPIDLMPDAKATDPFAYEPAGKDAQPPVLIRPPTADSRKLSREERKLQRYIEFFERMDAIDKTTKPSRKKSVQYAASSAQSTTHSAYSPASTAFAHDQPSLSPKSLKKQWMNAFKMPIAAPRPIPAAEPADHHSMLIDVVSVTPVAAPADEHTASTESRLTPLSQIISSEGTTVPGETPRKRLSLNDYLEKRRRAASPLAEACPVTVADGADDTEEGQIVE